MANVATADSIVNLLNYGRDVRERAFGNPQPIVSEPVHFMSCLSSAFDSVVNCYLLPTLVCTTKSSAKL